MKTYIPRNDVFITTKKGRGLRFNFFDVPFTPLRDKNGKMKSRKSYGVKLIKLDPDDEVVAVGNLQNNTKCPKCESELLYKDTGEWVCIWCINQLK